MSEAKRRETASQQTDKLPVVIQMLDRMRGEIAAALPRHLTPERLIRVARTAIRRDSRLLECEPLTVIASIVEAAQLGLEPDSILGHAYLVPIRGRGGRLECVLIPGYRGLIDLARRSGALDAIWAEVVRERDEYTVEFGANPRLVHRPHPDGGAVIAAYAVAKLTSGTTQFSWLWRHELDAIRQRSRAGQDGPWVTDYEEMCKKTAIRRLIKLLPVSPEAMRLAIRDEYVDAGLPPEPLVEIPRGASALAARLGVDDSDETVAETGGDTCNDQNQRS